MEAVDPKHHKISNESTQDEIHERSTVVPKSFYKEDLDRAGMTVFQTLSQPNSSVILTLFK